MITYKNISDITWIACLFIIGLLLWCVHAQSDTDIMEEPQRDGTVNITKHDFMLLQQFIQAQNKLIAKNQADSDYWQNRYAVTEECVRENLKAGKMVMKCFNDLEI